MLVSCKSPGAPSVTKLVRPSDAGSIELPHEAADRNDTRSAVSPIEILARPKEFSGKRVRTEGYLRMRDEDMVLYVSEEFARHGLGTSSIAIQPGDCAEKTENQETLRRLDRFAERYVTITATFQIGDPKQLPFQVGRLCNIGDVRSLPTLDAGHQ